MRIGFVTQWYDPEPGPASIPGVFARALVTRGHDVVVLTGFPNYPGGEVYSGFRQRPHTAEMREGVEVHRVPLFANHGRSVLGRVANYSSFALSATTLAKRALRGVDVLWAYNSPVTVTLPLLRHAQVEGVQYVLHVQDLWPESVLDSGMLPGGRVGAAVERALQAIVELSERRAHTIAVISPSVRDLLVARGVPPQKLTFVPNPTDESMFKPTEGSREQRRALGWGHEFVVMYAGGLGEVQGLDTAVSAIAQLEHRPDIHLALVGDGIALESLRPQAQRLNVENRVTFVGRVLPTLLPELMAAADAHLVCLKDRPFLRSTLPSKMSSLLASGVPMIVSAGGDAAKLVQRAGAGLAVRPQDPQALAGAFEQLARTSAEDLQALGACGRAFYEREMSASAASGLLEQALRAAADARLPARRRPPVRAIEKWGTRRT